MKTLAFVGMLVVTVAVSLVGPAARGATAPPLPPLPVSPIATFRDLLAQPAASREAALGRYPEERRPALRARLEEYSQLSPELREERLRVTELYWFLSQLMRRSPAERADLLRQAPADLQETLAERLAVWDRIPEGDRRTLLEQDRAVRYLSRTRTVKAPPLPQTRPVQAPPLPVRAARDWVQLQSLTDAQRQSLQQRWQRLFEAPLPSLPARTLDRLPAGERAALEQVFRRLAGLTPEQRRSALESFRRLTSMPAADLVDFLRHAQRWEQLSPAERESWRQVAVKLPPLPPARSVTSTPAG